MFRGHQAAAEMAVANGRTQGVAGRMAGSAVPETLDEIKPPVPLHGLIRCDLMLLWLEIQRSPQRQCHLHVVRKTQRMIPVRLFYRGQAAQIRKNVISISTRESRVLCIGKRRI